MAVARNTLSVLVISALHERMMGLKLATPSAKVGGIFQDLGGWECVLAESGETPRAESTHKKSQDCEDTCAEADACHGYFYDSYDRNYGQGLCLHYLEGPLQADVKPRKRGRCKVKPQHVGHLFGKAIEVSEASDSDVSEIVTMEPVQFALEPPELTLQTNTMSLRPQQESSAKTKLCTFWRKSKCTRGLACQFAHSANEQWQTCKQIVCRFHTGTSYPSKCKYLHVGETMSGSDGRPDSSEQRKTLQRKFWLKGACRSGEDCAFAHGEAEQRRACSKVVCRFFRDEGYCRQHADCWFAHPDGTQSADPSDGNEGAILLCPPLDLAPPPGLELTEAEAIDQAAPSADEIPSPKKWTLPQSRGERYSPAMAWLGLERPS